MHLSGIPVHHCVAVSDSQHEKTLAHDGRCPSEEVCWPGRGGLRLQVHQFDFCAAGGASGEANNEAVFKLAGIRPGTSLVEV